MSVIAAAGTVATIIAIKRDDLKSVEFITPTPSPPPRPTRGMYVAPVSPSAVAAATATSPSISESRTSLAARIETRKRVAQARKAAVPLVTEDGMIICMSTHVHILGLLELAVRPDANATIVPAITAAASVHETCRRFTAENGTLDVLDHTLAQHPGAVTAKRAHVGRTLLVNYLTAQTQLTRYTIAARQQQPQQQQQSLFGLQMAAAKAVPVERRLLMWVVAVVFANAHEPKVSDDPPGQLQAGLKILDRASALAKRALARRWFSALGCDDDEVEEKELPVTTTAAMRPSTPALETLATHVLYSLTASIHSSALVVFDATWLRAELHSVVSAALSALK